MPDDFLQDDPYNPYSDDGGTRAPKYQGQVEPDRADLVMAIACLGWLVCPIFSIVAWVMARGDLVKMETGQMDSGRRRYTNAARIASMVHCLLCLLVLLAFCVMCGLTPFAARNDVGPMPEEDIGIPVEEDAPGAVETVPSLPVPAQEAPGTDPGTEPAADPGASVKDQYRCVFSLANQNSPGGGRKNSPWRGREEVVGRTDEKKCSGDKSPAGGSGSARTSIDGQTSVA